MRIIDADTHIDETEDTWEYMQESDLQFKPTTAYPPNRNPNMLPTRYWVIDGKRQLRFIRGDEESGTVVESRELLDVQVRLKHMDQLGTDIQVIYPTLFLMEATMFWKSQLRYATVTTVGWLTAVANPTGGCAGGSVSPLCRTWMKPSKKCVSPKRRALVAFSRRQIVRPENGRRIPISSLSMRKRNDLTCPSVFIQVQESPFSRRHGNLVWGSSGRGCKRRPSTASRRYSRRTFQQSTQASVSAALKEARRGVSFVDYDLRRRVQSRSNRVSILGGPNTILASNLFRDNRVYVTCQVDEDLPYILKYVGEDNLIVGSDYTHRDPSMELEFRKLLQQRADEGEIPQSAVQKILYDNPKTFYGL